MKFKYLSLLKTSYEFSKEKKPMYILGLIVSIIGSFLLLIQPIFLGQLFNVLQKSGENMILEFLIYLSLFTLVPILHLIVKGFRNYILGAVGYSIEKNYKQYLYELITKLPFGWHIDNHSGESINRFNKASKALTEFSQFNHLYFTNYVNFVISLGGIIYFCSKLGVLYTLIVLISLLVFMLIVTYSLIKFNSNINDKLDILNMKDNKINSLLFDYISNIRTIIALKFEKMSKIELDKRLISKLAIFKKVVIAQESRRGAIQIVSYILIFFILYSYGHYEYKTTGIIMVGNFIILVKYLDWFLDIVENFTWLNQEIVNYNAGLNQGNKIITDYENYIQTQNQISTLQNRNTISIHNLNFAYKSGEKNVLENISLQIHKGEKIGFVGESGSGKSTMLSILKGLYETKDIEMKIDDNSFHQSNLLADITALIPQDPEIFENTIRYNVSFGLEVDDESIMEFVRLARFDSVLERLPNGLDTDIKEKGVNLSGGEKQRLALARGLFVIQQRSLILLDEPTSSVDSLNELEIYKALFAKYSDKTIISSIHRLHLLSMFDKIYVFDKGQIIQSGTFNQLINQDGLLKTSWENYILTNNEN